MYWIDVDERSISILFPKSDETRVYARNNAPLSRIVFNINDEVQDQEGIKWIVESLDDRSGVIRYNVIRTLYSGEQEKKALKRNAYWRTNSIVKAFRTFIGKPN